MTFLTHFSFNIIEPRCDLKISVGHIVISIQFRSILLPYIRLLKNILSRAVAAFRHVFTVSHNKPTLLLRVRACVWITVGNFIVVNCESGNRYIPSYQHVQVRKKERQKETDTQTDREKKRKKERKKKAGNQLDSDTDWGWIWMWLQGRYSCSSKERSAFRWIFFPYPYNHTWTVKSWFRNMNFVNVMQTKTQIALNDQNNFINIYLFLQCHIKCERRLTLLCIFLNMSIFSRFDS